MPSVSREKKSPECFREFSARDQTLSADWRFYDFFLKLEAFSFIDLGNIVKVLDESVKFFDKNNLCSDRCFESRF